MRRVAAYLAAGLVLGLGGSAAADEAGEADRPGVRLLARPGAVTSVTVRVPATVPEPEARRTAEAVAAAVGARAGVEARGTHDGLRRYGFEARLAERASFTSARIDGSVWPRLRRAGLPVQLALPRGFRVVAGDVRVAEAGLFRTYDVAGDGEVVYAPAPLTMWGPLALLALVAVVALGVIRPYVLRVERGPGDRADKVHRVQVVQMASLLGMFVLLPASFVLGWIWAPAVVVTGLFPGTAGSGWVPVAAAAVGMAVLVLAYVIPLGRAVRPSYRRLRGIEGKQPRQVRAAVALVVPAMAVNVVNVGTAWLDGAARTAVRIVVFAAVVLLWPALYVAVLPTKPAPEELRARFAALCREHGVRVRGIKLVDAGATKVANAMLVGIGPLRWVLVTDYLADGLDDEALDAVLLHEIAHAKQHHLLKKLGAGVLAAAACAVLLLGLVTAFDLPETIALVGMMLAFPAALLLAYGLLGLRLERQADDYAAAAGGAEPLRRALDRLAELNATKRRTRLVWNLLAQHPGLDQRLDRLAARGAEAGRR